MKKRVIIAMSGGVDSSTVAAILKEQGYDCIGVHIQFWTDDTRGSAAKARNKCCTLEGLEDARFVASQLDIPFYVMNAVQHFKERVVDYFLETYRRGETPNPCVACNTFIKFGELLTRARELKADYVASGHYAKVARNSRTGLFELWAARDTAKDQSYFLYHLTQEKLRHIMFPLGTMLKSEVYRLAEKYRLARVAEKPESQGLCFFSESTPRHFLKRYLPRKHFTPGEIVTTSGRVLGRHSGLPLYTIGQRSGLGIGGVKGEPEGKPWYVMTMNARRNQLVVGREEEILENALTMRAVHFIADEIPVEPLEVEVRIRHRGELIPAVFEYHDGKGHVAFRTPARGVAAGQSAVLYSSGKVLGGGIIEKK